VIMRNICVGLMIGSAVVALAIAQTKSTGLATKNTGAKGTAKGAATKTATSAVRRVTSSAGGGRHREQRELPRQRKSDEPRNLDGQGSRAVQVRLNTSKGPVAIEVTRAWSPNGADRFYNLVRGASLTTFMSSA